MTTAKQKGEERRLHYRNQLMLEVEGRATVEEGSDRDVQFGFQGHTRDVSLRGLCLLLDQDPGIAVGQQFNVMIELFKGDPPIEAVGQLCWLKEQDLRREEQSTRMGLELLGIVDGPRAYERWIERITWY